MLRYVYRNPFFRLLAGLFDCWSSVFFPFFCLFRIKISEIRTILVIRLDHLGDILKTQCVFKILKEVFPKAKLIFFTTPQGEELFTDHPLIDRIHIFRPPWFSRPNTLKFRGVLRMTRIMRGLNVDLGIDLRGDLRHILAMFLSGVRYRVSYGITGGRFLLNLSPEYEESLPEEEKNLRLVLEFLKFNKLQIKSLQYEVYLNSTSEEKLATKFQIDFKRKIILIHPLAGMDSKMWPGEKWHDLISNILSKYKETMVIIVGKGREDYTAHLLDKFPQERRLKDLLNKTTLKDLAGLCNKAILVISTDSGPAHIAYILKRPLVLIASATNRIENWFRDGKNIRIIQKRVACLNCRKEVCPKKIHYCMESISVKEVMEKIGQLMNWRLKD